MPLCDMDYLKQNQYGNIRDAQLLDIVNSPQSLLLRDKVFGYRDVPSDFICKKCQRMQQMKVIRMLSKLSMP